jgi:tetratricopeptide (TPR) repeat protein
VGKFFLFSLLWWLTGNPFVAMLIILLILYGLDLRFVRLLPDFTKPIKRNRRLAALKRQLHLNPHDTSAKVEAARLLMEKKQYREAFDYLQPIEPIMKDSPEFLCDLGFCHLELGRVQEGEKLIRQALQINQRVKYGEPYLRLGEALSKHNEEEKALAYLEELTSMHTSSCEVYYRLGQLYSQLQQKDKANQAYREAVEVYRGLPTYKRRSERRWALLAWLKK